MQMMYSLFLRYPHLHQQETLKGTFYNRSASTATNEAYLWLGSVGANSSYAPYPHTTFYEGIMIGALDGLDNGDSTQGRNLDFGAGVMVEGLNKNLFLNA